MGATATASPYQALVAATAQRYGIPTNIALAQINQESGFNPGARSSAGAEGIAQFMPSTASSYGVHNPFNPQDALQGYGKMMSGLIQKYGIAGALSAYNSGNPNAYKDPNFAKGQTYNYVKNIMAAAGSPSSGGSSTGLSPIAALMGGNGAGASMADQARRSLLAAVLGSSQSIASGQGVSQFNPIQLLQALSTSTQGGGSSLPGSPLGGGPGAPSVVQAAKQYLGTPYKWGGNSKSEGLDCSSFLQHTFADMGIKIPRTTYDQVKQGQPVDLKQLQPGDAVFTEPGKNGPNHVGLYIGNGQVQESPHTGEINKIIPLQAFLQGGFVAARRYVA